LGFLTRQTQQGSEKTGKGKLIHITARVNNLPHIAGGKRELKRMVCIVPYSFDKHRDDSDLNQRNTQP